MKALLRRLRKLKEEQILFGHDKEGCLVLKMGLVYFTLFSDDRPVITFGKPDGSFHKFVHPRKMFFEIMRTINENK